MPASTAKRAIELQSTVGMWLCLDVSCCLLPVMFYTLVPTPSLPFFPLPSPLVPFDNSREPPGSSHSLFLTSTHPENSRPPFSDLDLGRGY